MIDFKNGVEVIRLLKTLESDTIPVYGIMTPQHMIEHLASAVQISSGKKEIGLHVSKEMAENNKKILLTTMEFKPVGTTSPSNKNLKELSYLNLEQAKNMLLKEMGDFDIFYKADKTKKTTHPRFGELNYYEWISFHNKHFTYHFKQFKLIK